LPRLRSCGVQIKFTHVTLTLFFYTLWVYICTAAARKKYLQKLIARRSSSLRTIIEHEFSINSFMAPKARRRSTRNKTVDSPEPKSESLVVPSADLQPDTAIASEEKCPACKNENNDTWDIVDKENWIRCDACKAWFHWRCVGESGDLETIDKWYFNFPGEDYHITVTLTGTAKTA
jgi:hypothetical protein